MKTKTGRYSGYIRPFSYLIDLIIINILANYTFPFHSNQIVYSILISFAWIVIAIYLGFYEVYRYTKVIAILNCALKQFILFSLFCLALELFYSDFYYQKRVVFFVLLSLFFILFFKLFIYYFLRKIRVLYGGNSRSVVLLGNNKSITPLKKFFTENPDYGYRLMKVFTLENHKKERIEECLSYVIFSKTNEIYCSMADLSDTQISDIIDFADNNLKTLKFIPDNKQIFSRTAKFEIGRAHV